MKPSLPAGDLRWRIDIVRPTYSQDATGEPTTTESAVATLPAKKMEQRVSEIFSGGSDQVSSTVIFRVRFRSDIQQSDNVVYSGQRYEITEVKEYGFRVGLDLVCQRVGENI